jgi:universal stress protein A
MNGYDKILVALELVGDEDHLIESALKVATDAGGISLLHVSEPTLYPAGPYLGAITMDGPKVDTEALQQRLVELAEKFSLAKDGHCVRMGGAAVEIHRVADKNGVDLVVVGSHGRQGIQLLLGSTANAVLHGARCDVLAVRVHDPA